MQSLNKIEIKGCVGSARMETFQENIRCVTISVATNYAYKSPDGCVCIDTTWFNVIAHEKAFADSSDMKKISKGKFVHVTGRLRIKRYASTSGEERTIPEIIAKYVSVIPDTEDEFFVPENQENIKF